MSEQFKPGDKVKVGKPTENNVYGSDDHVKEGAVGFIDYVMEMGCRVQFERGDKLVEDFSGTYRWAIPFERLALFEDKSEPNNPAEQAPTPRGICLRDWFAGQALAGLLGNSEFKTDTDVESEIPGAIAKYCYEAADAMLERRGK